MNQYDSPLTAFNSH